ncbi:FcoT family thioesterase [Nocardia sp. NPDC050710]|uniref:FcoT family thioesterase n=1 Tax=Nocardia sp. NPDC050710 TaxID=3157220 RepID=UPI0033F9F5CD
MTTGHSIEDSAILDATADDIALLARTMRPYVRKGTVYLKQARATRRGDTVVGVGEFGIAEPCYIDDTGHFNAVEFNISFNQIFYYTLAAAIRDRLIPELANWTLDDYWERQLPAILITRFDSRYRRPIGSRAYTAELTIGRVEFRNRTRPLFAVQSHIEFTDAAAGCASGDIEVVLLDPPGFPEAGRAQ